MPNKIGVCFQRDEYMEYYNERELTDEKKTEYYKEHYASTKTFVEKYKKGLFNRIEKIIGKIFEDNDGVISKDFIIFSALKKLPVNKNNITSYKVFVDCVLGLYSRDTLLAPYKVKRGRNGGFSKKG
jgi:hypothetical protein